MFNFKYIQQFDRNLIKNPLPMIVLATPGMLHGIYKITKNIFL